MRPVQPVSVHIAVLSVAKDPKHPDHNAIATAVERATGAGHEVVEQATVKDSEPAVREQLTRWITDSNVDVVLVLGGADSETASSAMKPLVSSVLPGFTDLFRWLAFQEIGASAMLSQAEAAQCGQAYVFVLPGAIGAAMDKLILPQLDPNTTPKNLLGSLSRLQARIAEAVPTAIHGEKTQGGAGLPPKMPALPMRKQTKTGANIIPRNRAVDDPPTKPIDLERLQREIELSESRDQATRKTDLAKLLPKLPPGADEYLEPDADEDLTDAELLAAPPPIGMRGPKKPQTPAERARHEAATPPSPTPIVMPPAALKPSVPGVPAVIPPITQGPKRPPTVPPPAPLRSASSPTTAGGMPPRPPAQIPSLVKPGTMQLPSITKPASPGASALAAAWEKPGDQPPTADAKGTGSTRASTEPKHGAWIEAKTTPSAPARSGFLDAKTTPSGPATPVAGTPITRVTPAGRPTPPGGLQPRTPASAVPTAPATDTKTLPIARVATPVAGTPASELSGTPSNGTLPTNGATATRPPVPDRPPIARPSTPPVGTPRTPSTPPAGTPSMTGAAAGTRPPVPDRPSPSGATSTMPPSGATAMPSLASTSTMSPGATSMSPTGATSTMSASSVAASPATSTSPPADELAASISSSIATTTATHAAATTASGSTSKTPTTELDPSELGEAALEEAEPASTTSPVPVATAAPSQRLPRPPTPPPVPAARTRQPTPPPIPAVTRPPVVDAPPPLAADAPSVRTSASDLPRGTFTYPVQRRKSGVLLKLVALACAAGLGFVAVVYVLPMFMTKNPPAPTTAQVTTPPTPPVETPVETPPVETPVGSGGGVIETPEETQPEETQPEETQPEEPDHKVSPKPARPGHKSTGAQTPKPTADTPDLEPMPKPDPKPEKPVEEPLVDDGCDETSCILSKYEKACCEKYKPKTSDLSTRTGAGVPENLDKMMVRAGVEKVKPRVVKCGEKAGVKGEVKIAMTVSPAGTVSSAAVESSPDAGLGTCVLAAMKAASFGKSVNGGTFTYPFMF